MAGSANQQNAALPWCISSGGYSARVGKGKALISYSAQDAILLLIYVSLWHGISRSRGLGLPGSITRTTRAWV